MKALLRTNFRRYFRHPLFRAALIFAAFLGIVGGRSFLRALTNPDTLSVCEKPDIFLFLFLLYAQAAVLAAVIASQHRDGVFRNKVIAGNSKSSVFLAELLTGLTVSVMLFAAFAVPFALLTFRRLQTIPLRNVLAGTGMLLLIFLTTAAPVILFCTQISRRIPALILCTGGMLVLFAANYVCGNFLYPNDRMVTEWKLTDDPQATETLNTYHKAELPLSMPASSGVHWNEDDILVGKDGKPVDTDGSVLDETGNPVHRVDYDIKYIGGPLRAFLTVVDTLNPLRPLSAAAAQFLCFKDETIAQDILEYHTEHRSRLFSLLPRYLPLQIGALALYCTGGWLLFRKKELN